jgi:hypothetical protein
MVMVYRSKFTPGFPEHPNGREYPFEKGDKARCVNMEMSQYNGCIVTIDSELMRHDLAPGDGLVYEVIFEDGSGRHAVFIDRLEHAALSRDEVNDD